MSDGTRDPPVSRSTTSVRKKQLKASCDFCSLSKLKCDRGQPGCQRCINNGVECHYSEARRVGRARRTYNASTHSERNIALPSQGSSNSASSAIGNGNVTADVAVRPPEDSYMFDFDISAPFDSQYAYDQTIDLSDDRSLETYLATPVSTHIACPGVTMDAPGPMTFGDLGGPEASGNNRQSVDYGATSQCAEGRPVSGHVQSQESFGVIHQRHAEDCMGRAIATIQMLHKPSAACCHKTSTLPENTPQNLGLILDNNHTAIRHATDILNCSCSKDRTIHLLVASILHKLTDTYKSLLEHQQCEMMSNKRSLPARDNTQERSCFDKSLVFDVPVTVGNYALDTEIKMKTIISVVKFELRRIDALREKLHSRSASEDRSSSEGSSPFAT